MTTPTVNTPVINNHTIDLIKQYIKDKNQLVASWNAIVDNIQYHDNKNDIYNPTDSSQTEECNLLLVKAKMDFVEKHNPGFTELSQKIKYERHIPMVFDTIESLSQKPLTETEKTDG